MEKRLDGSTESLDNACRKDMKERREKWKHTDSATEKGILKLEAPPKRTPHGAQLKGSTRTCSKCGEVGHFAKTCGRKKKERKKRKPKRVPEGGGGGESA